MTFDPYWEKTPTGDGYYHHILGGEFTNHETHAVTIKAQAKLYEVGECDPTFTFGPVYTVVLNPGESWSPPDRFEGTITRNYNFGNYTMYSELEWCR